MIITVVYYCCCTGSKGLLFSAMLLDLSSPIEYQIETPPHTPEKDGALKDIQDINGQQCRNCQALLQQEGVKKRFAELGLTPKEDVSTFNLHTVRKQTVAFIRVVSVLFIRSYLLN